MSARARVHLAVRLALVALAVAACEPERPPAPEPSSVPAGAPTAEGEATAEVTFDPSAGDAVLTYVGERGHFVDTGKVDAVPEGARGLVRVTMLGGPPPPPGMVWVANLETAKDGRYPLHTVPRDQFEFVALEGRSSKAPLPEGLKPPEQVAAAQGVIIYKTAWCGVCKSVEKYMKAKGVAYEAKDIEKDHAAAAELQAKAKAQGVRTGSVPIIDVGGQLIVGFDRARLDKLLAT